MARKVTHPISIRLSEEVITKLDALADKHQISRSQLILRAINRLVDAKADDRMPMPGEADNLVSVDISDLKRRMNILELAVGTTGGENEE